MSPPMVSPIEIHPCPHFSASVVTANGQLWEQWSQDANVRVQENNSLELQGMVQESRKFPPWLEQEASLFPPSMS
jgi:hypothetical protein